MPNKRVGPAAAALSRFEKDFAKSFGEGALMTPKVRAYDVVSTGSLALDYAMGCGGYVVGRITETWGPESSAKTTLTMIGASHFQQKFPNRLVGWIDMERTFDPGWARDHGMNLDQMHWVKPRSTEDVSDMARKMVASGLYGAVVLDSVGGTITDEELKKNADEASMMTSAKVITRFVKQSAVLCDAQQCSALIVNQPRANIGYGADTQTAGPFALRHASTHKLKLRRASGEGTTFHVGSGKNQTEVGFRVAVLVERNKVAPPKKTAFFDLFNQDTDRYGPLGIDQASEAFEIAVRDDIAVIMCPAQGSYLLPGVEKPIRGKDKVVETLRKDSALLDAVRTKVLLKAADQVADEVALDVVDGDVVDNPFATGAIEDESWADSGAASA